MINRNTKLSGIAMLAVNAVAAGRWSSRYFIGIRLPATLVILMVSTCSPPPEAIAEALEIAELPADREVVFSRDIAPVLKKNCVACHNASSEEGGVNLESVATMQESDAEDVLVPGKPEASRLFVLASHAEDPVMPPSDNDVSASPLAPLELALLRRWIKSGAKVDQAFDAPTRQQWQPLPTTLQTVYGSAMTPDGRLSAVSFANQIRLYGSKSDVPIGSLEIGTDESHHPAHDDFVQDLFIDAEGQLVISAGFRNVKFWERSSFETTPIPSIDQDDVLAVATNDGGSVLATLSSKGEVAVANIGQNRWHWLKGFDVPAEFQSDSPPPVLLAVDPSGQSVAVAWERSIRLVNIDGIQTETIDAENPITALSWGTLNADIKSHDGSAKLVTGDATGKVCVWHRDDDVWSGDDQSVSDQAISKLCVDSNDGAPWIAIDAAGKVYSRDPSQAQFTHIGQLPGPPTAVSFAPENDSLWITTAAGLLGSFNIRDKKFVEVAKTDPVSESRYGRQQWEMLVGEKQVAATDQAVKQAEANVEAEKKSIESLDKDIAAKTTAIAEKRKSVADAKTAAESAAAKLEQARAAEQDAAKMRTETEATIKQLDADIAEAEARLEKLKNDKAESEKKLAAIPDAKKLADAVKTETEAVEKATKESAKQDSELADELAALKLAEETKARGETRLKGLTEEASRRQQTLEQAKADQQARATQTAESKSLLDQSKATDQNVAVIAGGSRLLTRSETSGTWSLWSGAGDWLGRSASLPADAKLVAAGNDAVVIRDADGKLIALKPSRQIWQHRLTIGSTTGDSPFADRVLSVDVDPSGTLLATGGGEPSRGGELILWNISDGSPVRRFEAPDGGAPHGDTVLCVRFSPDGKTLATGSADRMIKLWDVASGKLIKSLEGHTHHVTAIAWNVNLQQLASGSADATVKIWDIRSGQSTRTISGLKSEITRLVYVGRDDRIGIACGDSYFRVYRTDNGGRETNAKVPGGYLYALDANRDGTQFIVGGADGVATLIDKSGKQIQTYSSAVK